MKFPPPATAFAMLVALGAPALPASRAFAQTMDLSWDNCAFAELPVPASDKVFACNGPDWRASLFVTFRTPPEGFAGFSALVADLDLRPESGLLPYFWQLGPGQCNYGGLQLSDDRPFDCGSSANDLRDPVQPAFFLFQFGYTDTRAHLKIGYSPNRKGGQNLARDASFVAFQIILKQDSVYPCTGCTTPVAIALNKLRLENVNSEILTIETPGSFGQCVTTFGAPAGVCEATPARNVTWGTVKSLYR
jgi:hypothetical protein